MQCQLDQHALSVAGSYCQAHSLPLIASRHVVARAVERSLPFRQEWHVSGLCQREKCHTADQANPKQTILDDQPSLQLANAGVA